MDKKVICFVSLIIGLAFFTTKSFGSHEITYFQNNKKGAVSLTFDDGYSSQVTNGIPLLNARNLKGTFFMITDPGWINSHVSWETWRDVASQGHEIGNATLNHFDLTALPEGEMKWELRESQRMINENIPTLSSAQGTVIFAVNCGGPAYVDQTGILYQADTVFSGGRERTTKATIEGTEDDLLYQSERYGNFSYNIPVSSGIYTVTLKFAETYYNVSGKRLFDVKMEGQEVVTHLDLFAQAGKNKAYDLFIPIHVTDGVLNIDFLTERGQAKVNAIVVTPSKPCLSLAYPFGASNPQVQLAASETYIAARGTWASEGGFLNYYQNGAGWKAVNFLNIGSYEVDEYTALEDLDYYLNLAEKQHAWFSVHLYEITHADSFLQFLDHLLTKDVWVDTFGAIVRYMQERLSSTLTVLSESSSQIRLRLFHSLDPTIYDLPLTIRSSVPSHWVRVQVKQGDFYQTVIPIKEDNQTVVYYSVTPNGEEIVLSEDVIFAVNCGGPGYVDKEGIIYQTDTLFSGGRARVSKATIEGTEDDALYQSERYGNFSYNIPVSNGNYTVILKFAETRQQAAGRSVFDVEIEGRKAVSHLDLFAQAGKNRAYDISVPVNVMDGVLNIHFVAETGQAKVSAIIVNPS